MIKDLKARIDSLGKTVEEYELAVVKMTAKKEELQEEQLAQTKKFDDAVAKIMKVKSKRDEIHQNLAGYETSLREYTSEPPMAKEMIEKYTAKEIQKEIDSTRKEVAKVRISCFL